MLLVYLINLPTFLYSQTHSKIGFTHLDKEDGLPNNKVYDILRDNMGFLWIATNDGLCRYESSNQTKIYQAGNPKITGGLQSSNIRVIYQDQNENLWIGTRLGGLTRLHQPTGTWKTFRHDAKNANSISHDEILSIAEDHKGHLWVGTEDGLNMFDYQTETFIRFKMDRADSNALSEKAILSILVDDKGWVWVGTWAGGLHLLLPAENGNIAESSFKRISISVKNGAQNIWKIYQDKEKRYWLGAHGGGLFLMQLPTEANVDPNHQNWQPQFYNYLSIENNVNSISNDYIQDICEDQYGYFWVATAGGMNRFAMPSTENSTLNFSCKPQLLFKQFMSNASDPTSIVNNHIQSVFEDVQGIIWIGTYNGVSKYNWSTNQFDNRAFFDYDAKTTNTQNLYVDQQGIAWIGYEEEGLLRFDFGKNKLVKIDRLNENLVNSHVTTLTSPDDKRLFIGNEKGVSILNLETYEVVDFPIPDWIEEQFDFFMIRNLFVDSQDQVWLGTTHGVLLLDNKRNYTYFLHNSENDTSISDNSINQILEDSKKNVWIATYNGLNKVINKEEGGIHFERFKTDSKNPKSLASNQVISLSAIDSILYIGTTNGLSGYNFNTSNFTNFSKNGHKNFILSIEKTKDGNLWLSSIEGMSFFDTQKQTFNFYGKKDGLDNLKFDHTSSDQDKNGYLYFGHKRGITRFHPDHIVENEMPPPVYVTEVRTMNKEGMRVTNSLNQKTVELNHDDYYIALSFTALNYNRSEKNNYAYMLEGLEEQWNYSSSNTPATYTNLKPGNYTFRMKASNNDGVWNEEGLSLKIVRHPAFWETWLFYNLCLLLIVLSIWLGVKRYTKSIKDRNIALKEREQEMEHLVKERTKELEVKNEEIRSLLGNIKSRNEELEKIVEKRTRRLKASNDDLIRSNKDLEQFAYIASHDLQEPLRVVGGFVGLLGKKYEDQLDEEAFEYIHFAVDGVKRMSKLVSNLLTYSKVGRKGMDFQIVNLNSLLKLNLLDLSKKIKDSNAIIEFDSLPNIFCEKSQISMVFYNLINNAIKFNESDQPLIRILSHDHESEDLWTFSVEDNGIGIKAKYQQKIFEIFRRLHGKREYEGTGIGLALCKKIVNSHRGEIWFESTKGNGTTFFFTISKNITEVVEDDSKEVMSSNEIRQKIFN